MHENRITVSENPGLKAAPHKHQLNNDVERNQIRVLIVDDDPRYTEMLEVALEVEGIRVTRIQDPREAHEAAARQQPDVIVSDVAMPGLDGFTLVAGLKADARTADIPVIFVSARSAGGSEIARISHIGMDYLSKPFSVPDLVRRIRTAVEVPAKGAKW